MTVIVSRVGDLEHRQVGADDGVEQPLLAERVGAEALDVGHVASGGRSPGRPARAHAVADGDEVERPVEVALGRRRSAKSEAAIAGTKRS